MHCAYCGDPAAGREISLAGESRRVCDLGCAMDLLTEEEAAAGVEGCPACPRDELEAGRVPDVAQDYSREHCEHCADAIEARANPDPTGGLHA